MARASHCSVLGMILSVARAGDAGRGGWLVAPAPRAAPRPAATRTDGRYVVATTGIWADIAGRVACDGSLDVRTIVPAGGDPHSFEPSLRDRETLDGAALVVANGLGLEETLDDTLAAGRGRWRARVPRRRARARRSAVPTRTATGPTRTSGSTRPGSPPPSRPSATALVEAGADASDGRRLRGEQPRPTSPRSTRSWRRRSPRSRTTRRMLVTNHDALGYLADRYDFEILGSVLPSTSTLTEASPGELEELGAAIEAAGVPAIFTERFSDSADADAARRPPRCRGRRAVQRRPRRAGIRRRHLRRPAAHRRRRHRRRPVVIVPAPQAADRARSATSHQADPAPPRETRARELADRPVGVVGRAVPRQLGDGQRPVGRAADGRVHVARRHVGRAARHELPRRRPRPRRAAGHRHRLRHRRRHHARRLRRRRR